MFRRHSIPIFLASLFALAALVPVLPAQSRREKDKTVWNYDGGLFLQTDGSLPSGSCFGLTGRATAADFFDDLKGESNSLGTLFHRGHDIVTEFPAQLHVSMVMADKLCPSQLKQAGTRVYLTRDAVSDLRLSFYWKRGMKLRPATGVVPGHFETRRILPYAADLAGQLPERLEWLFEFDVPSAGVPLTDSLVIVMHTSGGQIAARAALRM
jgi:hypothetical protein